METYINKDTTLLVPANQEIPLEYHAGDFILIKGKKTLFSSLIRFGQSFRFRGEDSKYVGYTHAAMFADSYGNLIEALGNGVRTNHISEYKEYDFLLVRISATDIDREKMSRFIRASINDGYGWTTIVSIALSLMTGLKFSFGFMGQEICSGLIARALERTDFIPPVDASHCVPAALAKWFSE